MSFFVISKLIVITFIYVFFFCIKWIKAISSGGGWIESLQSENTIWIPLLLHKPQWVSSDLHWRGGEGDRIEQLLCHMSIPEYRYAFVVNSDGWWSGSLVTTSYSCGAIKEGRGRPLYLWGICSRALHGYGNHENMSLWTLCTPTHL